MRVNYDIICNTADISIEGVECCFDSAAHFKQETGFDFPNAKKVFFEPERNIYIIERSGGRCEIGSDLPELLWLQEHIQLIKQAGVRVNVSREPVITWRMVRADKLYATDWLMNRHSEQLQLGGTPTLTNAQYTELLGYRQSLRDLTDQNHEFPTPPSFVQLG